MVTLRCEDDRHAVVHGLDKRIRSPDDDGGGDDLLAAHVPELPQAGEGERVEVFASEPGPDRRSGPGPGLQSRIFELGPGRHTRRGSQCPEPSLAQAGEIGVGNHQPLPRLLSEYGKTWRGSDYWLTSDLLIRFDVIADYQRRRASGGYNVAKL